MRLNVVSRLLRVHPSGLTPSPCGDCRSVWRPAPVSNRALRGADFPTRWGSVRNLTTEAVAAPGVVETKQSAVDVFTQDSRPVILFDGVCNFCNAGVNLVLSLDQNASFRFAALQSEVGKQLLQRCHRHPDDISSMVVVEKDAFYIRSDAALKIGERLQIPFSIFSTLLWPVPRQFRDKGYDWIAENRYRIFGMRDTCRLTDENEAERFLS